MAKFNKGDKVRVTFPGSWYGLVGTVTEEISDCSFRVQFSNGRITRWMPSSLELAECVAVQPLKLCQKQQAVFEAATGLREAQIKFTKALDALNTKQ